MVAEMLACPIRIADFDHDIEVRAGNDQTNVEEPLTAAVLKDLGRNERPTIAAILNGINESVVTVVAALVEFRGGE
jgi:hypothetical protein